MAAGRKKANMWHERGKCCGLWPPSPARYIYLIETFAMEKRGGTVKVLNID